MEQQKGRDSEKQKEKPKHFYLSVGLSLGCSGEAEGRRIGHFPEGKAALKS